MYELAQLERELHSAGTRQSQSGLKELLHPDFREIGRSAREYSLAIIHERLGDGEPPKVHAEQFRKVDKVVGFTGVVCGSRFVERRAGRWFSTKVIRSNSAAQLGVMQHD